MVIWAVLVSVLAVAAVAGFVLWQRLDLGSPPEPVAPELRADRIEVHKAARRLDLLRDGRVLASYRVALGFAPLGHKEREGDGRTPEGSYLIDWRNPQSSFHLSLHVSYPDAADRARAAAAGVSPGGDIMIHGQPNGLRGLRSGHPDKDWTVGCIAVTNREMREIWARVADGTPIRIHP